MYQLDKRLLLRSSASAVGNNLAVVTTDEEGKMIHVGVIHKGSMNIVCVTVPDNKPVSVMCKGGSGGGSTNILQAKWCSVNDRLLLVLASVHGIQVFDWDGSAMLYNYQIKNTSEEFGSFLRGIAACGSSYICVGTNKGTVLVFSVPQEDSDFVLIGKQQAHASSITDLASSGNMMASGDESGVIILWDGAKKLQKTATIESYGAACTSLAIWKGMLVAGYGSGHLRVFSTTAGLILAEVAAHARWVTGVDVATETGLVLSVSEDSFVKVWQLASGAEECAIVHKFSESIQDAMLVGGRFLNKQGSMFCMTGFDMSEVICYAM